MDMKVVFVFVCLSALAITSTDAGIPKCCIRARDQVPPQLLYKTYRWERQDAGGACDIDALLLFFKGKRTPMCVITKWERILLKIQKDRQQRKKMRT